MRFVKLATPFLILAFTCLPVQAQKAAKGDSKHAAAVSACLQQISKAYEAYDKLTDKQREKAEQPSDASTCIGAASGPCLETAKDQSTKTEAACARGELAVWQAHLDARLGAYLKEAKPDETAAMKKVNAAWQAYRDARCAYPALDNKNKDDAAARTANCLLTMTGQHALWIDAREN